MGRKDKTSKSAQKKKDRLELEKKMNERVAIVKAANDQPDPLATLPSFKTFTKNGMNIRLSTTRLPDLDEKLKVWLMDLIERNMKALYEKSTWGWQEKNKKEEMYDDAAWYLIAENADDNTPIAYAHFRYDMDYDDEVLYVYEIQMEEQCRRKGLGRFMMQILEMLAFKADMRKIMLTVFKHNEPASKFFKNAMKFEIDETSLEDDIYEQFDYEIVSKFNKRKLANEAKQENIAALANQQKAPAGRHHHGVHGAGCC